MRVFSVLLLLLACCCCNAQQKDTINHATAIGASQPDSAKKRNTPEELEAIKTAYNSLDCNCSSPVRNPEGAYLLYKDGRISQKGIFYQYKLICGVKCVYDKSNRLILIQVINEGKCIREEPFPGK